MDKLNYFLFLKWSAVAMKWFHKFCFLIFNSLRKLTSELKDQYSVSAKNIFPKYTISFHKQIHHFEVGRQVYNARLNRSYRKKKRKKKETQGWNNRKFNLVLKTFSGMCFSSSSKREMNYFKITLNTVTIHTTQYMCGCVFCEDSWKVSIIPTGDITV